MFSMHLAASASARLESGWDNATADCRLPAGFTSQHNATPGNTSTNTRPRDRKKGRKEDTETHLHIHTHTRMAASEGLTGTCRLLFSFKGEGSIAIPDCCCLGFLDVA